MVDNVLHALPKLTSIPEGVTMTLSLDQSMYIRQTISGLQREAFLGAVLAMIIILLFLRNIRGTLIIIVAIPLSILLAFIWFRFGGITLNIMTFGGLALAVGRLVDDSIVELEAISRHYGAPKEGETKLQATLAAAKEVAAPIFISTLTTVIVFFAHRVSLRNREVIIYSPDDHDYGRVVRVILRVEKRDAADVPEVSSAGKSAQPFVEQASPIVCVSKRMICCRD